MMSMMSNDARKCARNRQEPSGTKTQPRWKTWYTWFAQGPLGGARVPAKVTLDEAGARKG